MDASRSTDAIGSGSRPWAALDPPAPPIELSCMLLESLAMVDGLGIWIGCEMLSEFDQPSVLRARAVISQWPAGSRIDLRILR